MRQRTGGWCRGGVDGGVDTRAAVAKRAGVVRRRAAVIRSKAVTARERVVSWCRRSRLPDRPLRDSTDVRGIFSNVTEPLRQRRVSLMARQEAQDARRRHAIAG